MAIPARLPVVGGSSPSRSLRFDAQRSMNLYVESGSPGALAEAMLLGVPGKRRLLTFGDVGAVRGGIRISDSKAYVACNGTMYVLDASFGATSIGTIYAGTTPVSFASNGATVMVVGAGIGGWFIDIATNVLTQITDPDFAGGGRVDYITGFFIWNVPNTQRFQISRALSTAIDPLDFASAEGAPDLLVSGIVDHEEYWAFGASSTQVFANTGNTTFPIEKINGVFIETGCAAKYSPAKLDGRVFWLCADDRGQGMVMATQGYQAIRVSTHAVETAIAKMSTIADAIGWSYQQEGHSFYVLTFPTANQTWVYDAASQVWHERGRIDATTGGYARDRAMCAFAFGGQVCVGDVSNGKLYALDLGYYSDDGDTLPAFRQTQHVAEGNRRIRFWEIWVDVEVGVGLDGGAFGSDPYALLEWSDDGARTWTSAPPATIGRIGENAVRLRWRKLGVSRQRTWRITITDPVRRAIIDAQVRADVLAS